MHIYCDLEVQYPVQYQTFSDEAKNIVNTIKEFLAQRFGVLEEEMDKEFEMRNAFIMVLLPNEEQLQLLIGYPNFSDQLKTKLQDCISDNDIVYLNHLLTK